jgi:hypothetical protein
MGYTAGRGWIEYLRVDDVQMDDVFGLRLNVWTSLVVFLAAAAYFLWSARRHPGREEQVLTEQAAEESESAGSEERTVTEPADPEFSADDAVRADRGDPAAPADPREDPRSAG